MTVFDLESLVAALPPFHEACFAGDQPRFEALLNAEGKALATSSSRGRTPLHAAAAGNQAGIVKTLLALGAKPEIVDPAFPWPPLYVSVLLAKDAATGALLESGGVELATDALCTAVLANDLATAERLLDTIGVNPNGYGDRTPLILARTAAMAKLLVRGGASVNKVVDARGFTPLHIAIRRNDIPVAKVLLLHGGEGVPDASGRMPLSYETDELRDALAPT